MTVDIEEAQFTFDKEKQAYFCIGSWSILKIKVVATIPPNLHLPQTNQLAIDGSQLQTFDSSGALALWQWINFLRRHNKQIVLVNFTKEQQSLIKLIEDNQCSAAKKN